MKRILINSNFLKKGDVVFLFGEMGTGKTTFAKYLINSMQKKNNEDNITINTPIPYRDLSSFSGCFNKDLYRTNPELIPNLPKQEMISAALNKVLKSPI